MSSGDESSAYQAGAIKGIIESGLSADKFAYDSVSGVQGGALNAVLLSSFQKGDEVNAAKKMEEFWIDAANTALYKDWFGGIARGLFFEGGLYNSSPMESFLKKQFDNVVPLRKLDIGITNVIDGSYRDFSETDITQDDNLVDAMFASMSFAGFFPPADVLGSQWFDGSAVWDIDIFSAINRCKDLGYKNSDIVVDVIMTSSANLKQVQAEDYKSIGMLFRYLEISSFYNSMDGLLRARFAYKDVDFRYVITPTESMPSSLYPLNLNADSVQKIMDMGYNDAKNTVDSHGNGFSSIDDLIHYHSLKKSGKPVVGSASFGTFVDGKRDGSIGDYDIMEDPYMRKYTYKVAAE